MVTELIESGYRKTDIGVVPDDWVVTTLDNKGIFKKGKGVKKDEVTNEGLPCIRYGEIYTRYNYYVNRFFSFIPSGVAKKSQKIQKDDLLFTGSGETAEEIGKCIAYLGSEDVYAGGDIIIFSPNEGNSLFLAYLMNYESITKQKSRFAQGDAVVHIYAANLKEIILPFPKPQEQLAIAQALSDTDNIIDSLNKLINKKKNIKIGVMQELLTGNKRLTGFSGEWYHKKIKDIGEVTTGSTPPTKNKIFWNGQIPWVTPTDITEEKEIKHTEREITHYGLEQARQILKNSVLVTCIASIGKNVILKEDGACNQQINAVKLYEGNDYEFFYYLMEYNKEFLLSRAGITATNIIKKRDFEKLRFYVPRIYKEQSAIARILSNMDIEINSLNQQRDKYEMLKEGMMQQLLTGKIRFK